MNWNTHNAIIQGLAEGLAEELEITHEETPIPALHKWIYGIGEIYVTIKGDNLHTSELILTGEQFNPTHLDNYKIELTNPDLINIIRQHLAHSQEKAVERKSQQITKSSTFAPVSTPNLTPNGYYVYHTDHPNQSNNEWVNCVWNQTNPTDTDTATSTTWSTNIKPKTTIDTINLKFLDT